MILYAFYLCSSSAIFFCVLDINSSTYVVKRKVTLVIAFSYKESLLTLGGVASLY